MSGVALGATLVFAALCAGHGTATASGARVAVLPFGGTGGTDVHKAVSKTLAAQRFQLVPPDDFRAGVTNLAGNVQGAEAIRTVAAELRLAAVVMGKVTVKRRKLTALIVLRDARDGEVVEEVTFTGRSKRQLTRAVQQGFWKKLGSTFRVLAKSAPSGPMPAPKVDDPFASAPAPTPPAEPAPTERAEREPEREPAPAPTVVRRRDADAKAREEEEEEEDEPRTTRGNIPAPSRFELTLGPRLVFRQFTYVSDPDDALSEFRTNRPAPALGVTMAGFLRLAFPRLGLSISAEQATPMAATASTGLTYNTFSGDYNAAVLVGFPSRNVVLDLAVGGGRQRFALLPKGDAESRPRPIPNVTYDYIRAGLALRVYPGGPLTIYGGGHYRHVMAAGLVKSTDWFPSANIWGAEVNVGLGYRFLSWCEARLHGDLRLYNMTMSPDQGDIHVTDGARDIYWSASLSLAAFFGSNK